MANTIGTAYVQIEPSFEGVVPKIDKEFGGAGKESGNSFMSGFGSVLGTAGKVIAGATAAGATAVAGMVKSSTEAFADYEQLVGGVETLFEDLSYDVQENAARAFETAGMSANEYMETVMGFSASLNQSLTQTEGNISRSAELADMAIIDMSDNANKMGSSMESIQNAYLGFAKQNYTMLDNLKLGYGGTKTEMERLLKDAEKISGQKFDLSSYADVVTAIHVIQEEMGITGTTAEEAAATISGSLSMAKASWQNLLTAIGTGDESAITVAIENLVESARTVGQNVLPVIQDALGGISQLISELAPEIATALPEVITEVLPGLLDAGVQVVQSLGEGILSAVPELMPTITNIVVQLTQLLVTMLPDILRVGIEIIRTLADGIVNALPTLIPTIVEVFLELVNILTDPGNLQMIISSAIDIILALVDGLMQALPTLIAALPQIISSIITALTDPGTITMIIQAAISLVNMIVTNLPVIIQALVDAIPEIINAIAAVLTDPECISALIMGAIELVAALVAARVQICAALIEAIPQVIDAIIAAFEQLGPALIECFTQVFANLGPAFDMVKQYAQTAWTSIQNAFANVAPWFKKKFEEAVKNIKNVFNTVKTYFQQKYNEIVSVFAGIGSKFKTVGEDIVNGIKKGIGGTWESLKNFLKALCGDLVALAKKILGIESPSKVFRDEVGQWIPAGIAEGMSNGASNLKKAAKLMTGELLQTSLNGTVETINSVNYTPQGIADAGKTVVINNDIKVDGTQDPELWTQTFIKTLKREARMA